MTSFAVKTVETALDRYVTQMKRRTGFTPDTVRCATLAQLAKVDREDMSLLLQEYRHAQKPGGTTRYVIQGRGYGRAAMWYILALPGSDPKLMQRARRDAMDWAIRDASARWLSDVTREILPATTTHNKAIDQAINQLKPLVEAQLKVVVQHVKRVTTSVTI